MAKVTIEFEDVNSKTTAALIAMLTGKATAKKATAEEEDDDDEEEDDDDEEVTDDDDEEEVEETTTAKPTLEKVRTAAQKLIGAGKSAKLKAILKEVGVAKVVDVPKAKWAIFLKKCKAVK